MVTISTSAARIAAWVLVFAVLTSGTALAASKAKNLSGEHLHPSEFKLLRGEENKSRVLSSDLELLKAALRQKASQTELLNRRQRKQARLAQTQSTDSELAVASYSGSITEIIHQAAAEYGISGDWMVSIAVCESGLDPRAYNSAGYHGLFQYDEATWTGYGYGSIWDPVAQARTTAKLLAMGQSSRWPNCA